EERERLYTSAYLSTGPSSSGRFLTETRNPRGLIAERALRYGRIDSLANEIWMKLGYGRSRTKSGIAQPAQPGTVSGSEVGRASRGRGTAPRLNKVDQQDINRRDGRTQSNSPCDFLLLV